jgi:hypothetical protein
LAGQLFYVTDLRAGDWLAGALEIETRGSAPSMAASKSRALSLLSCLKMWRVRRRDDGQLFGEIYLSGTLDAPYAGGDFGCAKAFQRRRQILRQRQSSDRRRGWEISSLDIRKNEHLFAGRGELSTRHRRAAFQLRANDIDISEFLGTVAVCNRIL